MLGECKGAAYEIAFNDSEGRPLSGGASHKLTLPPVVYGLIAVWGLPYAQGRHKGLPG